MRDGNWIRTAYPVTIWLAFLLAAAATQPRTKSAHAAAPVIETIARGGFPTGTR